MGGGCSWAAELRPGWLLTMTGKGTPNWTVEREGGGVILKQSGNAAYPLALREGTSLRDGFVEVKLKPISGREDQAGGIGCGRRGLARQ